MSRESTPASLFGGLAITASPTSSADMPVTTRGMRNQRQRNLAASHQASAAAAASSSRAAAAPSGRQTAAGRSSGSAPTRSSNQRRRIQSRRTAHDSEDDDDESNEEDSDDEGVDRVVIEIMSTFADVYPTPREFSSITPHNTRNVSGNEQT